MPPLEGVQTLNLVGDFNNWSVVEHPLKQDKDGGWSVALTLDGGKDYQFRYFANGDDWHNDWAADRYTPNEHGSDNSVVSTKAEALPAAKTATKKAASKKK
jgi:1,4-alpha-glucan branching enzyme